MDSHGGRIGSAPLEHSVSGDMAPLQAAHILQKLARERAPASSFGGKFGGHLDFTASGYENQMGDC